MNCTYIRQGSNTFMSTPAVGRGEGSYENIVDFGLPGVCKRLLKDVLGGAHLFASHY